MSQASASSQPPPSANPLTAAIVGFGIDSRRRPHSWPSIPQPCASSTLISVISVMSAPAANAFSPAPVRTTVRASVSSASSRSRSRSSVSVSPFSALSTSGRSIVTTATPSARFSVLTPMPGPSSAGTRRSLWSVLQE